jgi:hypothetical protein
MVGEDLIYKRKEENYSQTPSQKMIKKRQKNVEENNQVR